MFIYPTWWSIIPLISSTGWFLVRPSERWAEWAATRRVSQALDSYQWFIMVYHGILNLSRTINHPVYYGPYSWVYHGLSLFFNVCQGFSTWPQSWFCALFELQFLETMNISLNAFGYVYIYIYWCIFWIDLSKIAYLDDFFLWSHDCHIDLLKVKWKKWRIAMEPWSHGGGGGFFPGSVRRVCSQTGTGARDSGQRTWMEGQAMAMGIPLN